VGLSGQITPFKDDFSAELRKWIGPMVEIFEANI